MGAAAPFVLDPFTGTANTDLAGTTPATGGVWSKDAFWSTGAIGFNGAGNAVRSNTVNFANYTNGATPPFADYRAECDLTVVSLAGQAGVTLRDGGGSNNLYWAYLDAPAGKWVIAVGNGVPSSGSILASGPANVAVGSVVHLTLWASNTQLALAVGANAAQSTVVVVVKNTTLTGSGHAGIAVSGLATDTTGIQLANFSATTFGQVPTQADAVARSLLAAVLMSGASFGTGGNIGLNSTFLSLDDEPFPTVDNFVACAPARQALIKDYAEGGGRHNTCWDGDFTLMVVTRDTRDQPWADTLALAAVATSAYGVAHAIVDALTDRFLLSAQGDNLSIRPVIVEAAEKPRRYKAPEGDGESQTLYRSIDVLVQLEYQLSLTIATAGGIPIE
jgi:hypothetical protein